MEKKVNILLINGGVSGDTTAGGLSRIDWSITDDINAVAISLGANDMLRGISPEETKKNLEGIINIAQTKNIKVMLAGMIAPNSHGAEYKKNFDEIYPTISKEFNIPLIPFLLEGVALKPEYNLSDGMHPNKEGTLIISKTLEKNIKEYFN